MLYQVRVAFPHSNITFKIPFPTVFCQGKAFPRPPMSGRGDWVALRGFFQSFFLPCHEGLSMSLLHIEEGRLESKISHLFKISQFIYPTYTALGEGLRDYMKPLPVLHRIGFSLTLCHPRGTLRTQNSHN